MVFEYTFDEKIWFPLGEVPLDLHIPWKDPSSVYTKLDASVYQRTASGKEVFRETLIWLGCKSATTLGNDTSITVDENEEAILDAVFKPFESLEIRRKREGETRLDGSDYLLENHLSEGMGYWRGQSVLSLSAGFRAARTARTSFSYFLSYGEARCGKWTDFLQHILLSQGISVGKDTIGICTEYGFAKTPYFPAYIEKTATYKLTPLN